jgi:biotin transport system substrate-specific component
MPKNTFLHLCVVALFAALITFGSYLKLPIMGVPITAQAFFIMMVGLLWGTKLALASVALWIGLGLLGLPVFAGAGRGLAFFFMPTAGYVLGYLLMALLTGWVSHIALPGKLKPATKVVARTVLLLPAMLSVYTLGLPWLRLRTGITLEDGTRQLMSWPQTFVAGCLPFILTDLIKTVLVAIAYELLFAHRRQK